MQQTINALAEEIRGLETEIARLREEFRRRTVAVTTVAGALAAVVTALAWRSLR